jgi:DNA-binding CsgD family transcriptional regulator
MIFENTALTARELDVVRLLARGRSYAQIADELGISVHTVTSHIKSLYRKLGVRSAVAAVVRAAELRLVPIDMGLSEASTRA